MRTSISVSIAFSRVGYFLISAAISGECSIVKMAVAAKAGRL